MEFLLYLTIAAVAWYFISNHLKSREPVLHCMSCGTDAQANAYTKGSIWIEIVLWLCLIVPGLIYSIWRQTNKARKCAACGSEHLVPASSPAAVAHRKQLSA